MKKKDYDFGGWVTKNDIQCQDGITIKHNAFADDDGKEVTLVWNHEHDDPSNILGKVVLENHPEGVYGYGTFNDTENGQTAKSFVQHGDVVAMSIFARKLKTKGKDLLHGVIREVSLVLAGANPGAKIDYVNLSHSEYGEDNEDNEVLFTNGMLIHVAGTDAPEDDIAHAEDDEETQEAEGDVQTVEQVMATMTEEQLAAVGTLIESIIEDRANENNEDEEEGDTTVKHNVFDGTKDEKNEDYLSHSEVASIVGDARKKGSGKLSDEFIAHGIDGIDLLFPDAKYENGSGVPQLFGNRKTATQEILAGVSKSPFSRVKNLFADVTEDGVRALGYITGDRKVDQVFRLLGRETHPQTIYTKHAFENDDLIDVEDIDLISFGQAIMRVKYDEELARAILIGDGRTTTDRNKIKEDRIRPIISDDDLYTIKMVIPSVAAVLEALIIAMGEYQGDGSPDLFIQPNLLAKLKLVKDSDGKYLFGDIMTDQALAAKLGVRKIVETKFLKNAAGIIVNLSDYTVGAAKGGQLSSYSDFDIDFNLHKFLMEGRCSGALTVPYSAIYFTVDETKKEVTMTQTGTMPQGYVAAFDPTKGNSSSVIRRTGLTSSFAKNDRRYGGTPDGETNPRYTGEEPTEPTEPTAPAGE